MADETTVATPPAKPEPGATPQDPRGNQTVMTQWRKLQELKRQLVAQGKLNGDATAQQVLTAVRAEVPQGLF